jgi:penicillin-binding protein 1C
LFHAVMLAAARRFPAPASAEPFSADGADVELCALSGQRAGPHCAHRIQERFLGREARAGTCDWHVQLFVDARDGGLSSAACPGAEGRVFERYPAQYWAWAEASGRPLPPQQASKYCPSAAVAAPNAASSATPTIVFPSPGARFMLDASLSAEQQALVFRARGDGGPLRFVLDGKPLGNVPPPYTLPWRLTRGRHELVVVGARGSSDRVSFSVN